MEARQPCARVAVRCVPSPPLRLAWENTAIPSSIFSLVAPFLGRAPGTALNSVEGVKASACHSSVHQVSLEASERSHVECRRNADRLGLDPHEPDTWKSSAGNVWANTGGTFTNILDELHRCRKNIEWTKASTHLDSAGLEHGWSCERLAWQIRTHESCGGWWHAARSKIVRAGAERYDGLCPRRLAEGMQTEGECDSARKPRSSFACVEMRGLVPTTWTAVENTQTTHVYQGSMSWLPELYFSDGSGGVHSQDPRLRRAGWGVACLLEAEGLPRQRLGKANRAASRTHGVRRACGKRKRCRIVRGQSGRPRSRHFHRTADQSETREPQCSILVTREWRWHLTAKELRNWLLHVFRTAGPRVCGRDGEQAKSAEVLPSQAAAAQTIDVMAWQVRMRIFEANLAAFSAQPKCEFSPPRTPAQRKTRQQKRNELCVARDQRR